MAVNVSPVQLLKTDFVDTVLDARNTAGLEPHQLTLELTETLVADDPASVATRIHELHREGVDLALDDFGTGYSSLAYLKNFKFTTLKIDRSFVQSIGVSEADNAIVETANTVAHALGYRSVAEGVETKEQLKYLQSIGCDRAQGYFFSPPLEPENFKKFYQKMKGSLRVLS